MDFFYIYILIFTFLTGLCFGSLLNVIIYRLPLEKSIWKPRSACPKCGTKISWYYNIPIFSYIFLRGRCNHCKSSISWRYPFIELLTACCFVLLVFYENHSPLWFFYFYFICAVIVSAFIDLDHWIIPDKITLPSIIVGVISSFFHPQFFFLQSILGLLFGGGILLLVGYAYEIFAKKEGIGGGDIKFLAFVGSFLGVEGALVTLVLSSILGAILGLFLIIFKGKKGGTAIPFGPFLSLGALITLYYGPELWQWYFSLHP